MIDISRSKDATVARDSQQVLIDDSFSASEARDIVLALLDTSIDQQRLRNLRSQVHAQVADRSATELLPELVAARADLRTLLAQVGSAGLRVRVRSTISVEVETDRVGQNR